MALPALGVRAKHRKWAVQYNYSSSNADPGGISPFFGFFFFPHSKINSMRNSSCWWGTRNEGIQSMKIGKIKVMAIKGVKIQF